MTQSSLTERITRSLAYMLRHQPDEFDIELDDYGFAELEDVVRALNERLGEPIREQDVLDALASGDRPRYELQEGRIRALYGHSIAIDPGEPSEPPEQLFIGVSARDAGRAVRHGLQGGRRTFLHLAKTREDAEETAKRLGGDWAVIAVRARDAWEEGVNFYDRKALFLSEYVPTEFLDVGEVQRGQEVWGRGGGHGRRRDERDRDRDRDRESPREREPHREREPAARWPASFDADREGRRDELQPHRARHGEGEARRAPPSREPSPGSAAAKTQEPHEPRRTSRPASVSSGSTDFGLGIFEAKARAEPPPIERPIEGPSEPRSGPIVAEEETDRREEGSGFGAGII